MFPSFLGFTATVESANAIRTLSNQRFVFIGYYIVSICISGLYSSLINLVAPLLPIGLFGFAWTSLGPPQVHWIAPMIFSTLIAIANVSTSPYDELPL